MGSSLASQQPKETMASFKPQYADLRQKYADGGTPRIVSEVGSEPMPTRKHVYGDLKDLIAEDNKPVEPATEATTLGTDTAEAVKFAKTMFNVTKRDIEVLINLANEVNEEEIETALESKIGKVRAAMALEAFAMNFVPPQTELEAKLRKVSLTDLKLATGDEDQVKEIRSGFKKGLLALPAR